MRVALVTGGGRGIGKAIAFALGQKGNNVTICARNVEGMGNGLQCDVTVAEDIKRVVQTVIDRWERLDILINNVGGGGERRNEAIEDTPEEVWESAYQLNALSAIRFTRLVIPYMKRQNWGRVVTIASDKGREAGGAPWYSMAKASEICLMKTLAMTRELAQHNITFNSVAPSAVMFPGNQWDALWIAKPTIFWQKLAANPQGRFNTPEDVANVVAWLCSDEASRINGACIPIDGGESRSF